MKDILRREFHKLSYTVWSLLNTFGVHDKFHVGDIVMLGSVISESTYENEIE